MTNWKQLAVELYTVGKKPKEIHEILRDVYGIEIKASTIRVYLCRWRKALESFEDVIDETKTADKRVVVQNQEPTVFDAEWDGAKLIKFAVISDIHIGSKYTQLTHLNNFYDRLVMEGVKTVYNAGDITEGLKMRPGQEYEVYTISADEMRDDVIKNYPKRDGITTYFITGNHDASIYKHIGYDIGAAIADKRSDMIYLGRDCATVNITPNCTLELRHPWDGVSYATSYRLQKMIEAMESDSKPSIIAVGHYHKQLYMFYRNVHGLLTGCFQGQTPFFRGKGIASQLGGWIVTIRVSDEGVILSFNPEFVPYYSSIKEDYKSYK